MKNISERLHYWKVFGENVLQIRSEKGTIDDLLCERLLKLVKVEKNASYNKALREEIKFLKKRLNSYIRAKPQLLEKVL